jgi:hypothetical protein
MQHPPLPPLHQQTLPALPNFRWCSEPKFILFIKIFIKNIFFLLKMKKKLITRELFGSFLGMRAMRNKPFLWGPTHQLFIFWCVKLRFAQLFE